jgi:hypothetical protein
VTNVEEPDFAGTEVRGAPRDERVRGESGSPAAGLLTGRQLLVLQLRGRRYAREQVAALTAVAGTGIEQLERSACRALGVATVEEAIELARRRGLIL